jgi:tetrahydromethanopterin S-methyltransferase subunit A
MKKYMESDIQLLELASGIKDSLIKAGFTISGILGSSTTEISKMLGVDSYIAQLIFEEAEKVRASAIVRAPNKDNDIMT